MGSSWEDRIKVKSNFSTAGSIKAQIMEPQIPNYAQLQHVKDTALESAHIPPSPALHRAFLASSSSVPPAVVAVALVSAGEQKPEAIALLCRAFEDERGGTERDEFRKLLRRQVNAAFRYTHFSASQTWWGERRG